MKHCTDVARQGELRFEKISENPTDPRYLGPVSPMQGRGLRLAARLKGKVIVGHSETGHHHVMLGKKTNLYELFGVNERILSVKEPDDLVHEREDHQHERLHFEPGLYRVVTAREYIPGSGRFELKYQSRWSRD